LLLSYVLQSDLKLKYEFASEFLFVYDSQNASERTCEFQKKTEIGSLTVTGLAIWTGSHFETML
jgi:hypothetical protein